MKLERLTSWSCRRVRIMGEEKKPKVMAQLVISIIEESPPRIAVSNSNMNPYMIPTLLRQLAKNYEEAVMATRSLIE